MMILCVCFNSLWPVKPNSGMLTNCKTLENKTKHCETEHKSFNVNIKRHSVKTNLSAPQFEQIICCFLGRDLIGAMCGIYKTNI